MEETYWQQFMATGRIEDYLQFKGVSNIEGETRKRQENGNREKMMDVKEERGVEFSQKQSFMDCF